MQLLLEEQPALEGRLAPVRASRPVAAVASRKIDSYTPRTYQQETFDAGVQAFRDGKDSLAVLFTGAGKTYSMALFADWWLQQDPDAGVLVLAPSDRELTFQLRDEMRDFFGLGQVALDMGQDGRPNFRDPDAPRIVVACRATIGQPRTRRKSDTTKPGARLLKYDPTRNWLVMFDEAHNYRLKQQTTTRIVKHFKSNPQSRLLGMTATPRRGDKVSLANLFPEVIQDLPLRVAIMEGYSVPCDQRFVIAEGVSFSEIKTKGSDFDEDELARAFANRETMLSIVRPIIDLAEDRRTIVFCNSVMEARTVAHTINAEVGSTVASSMYGETPKETRNQIKSAHRSGNLQFVCTCNMMMEGYDDVGISCVALVKRTKSKKSVEQMIGRGSRVLRGVIEGLSTAEERIKAIAESGKPDFRVIDLVGVDGVHGPSVTATEVLAEGMDDEMLRDVLDRAESGTTNVEDAIREALEAAEKEREKREAAEKARISQEEEERRLAAQARREATLRAEVSYSERRVTAPEDVGYAAVKSRPRERGPLATDKQIRRLFAAGIRECSKWTITKAQASSLIGVLNKSGAKGDKAVAIAKKMLGVAAPPASTPRPAPPANPPAPRPSSGIVPRQSNPALQALAAQAVKRGVSVPEFATFGQLTSLLRANPEQSRPSP